MSKLHSYLHLQCCPPFYEKIATFLKLHKNNRKCYQTKIRSYLWSNFGNIATIDVISKMYWQMINCHISAELPNCNFSTRNLGITMWPLTMHFAWLSKLNFVAKKRERSWRPQFCNVAKFTTLKICKLSNQSQNFDKVASTQPIKKSVIILQCCQINESCQLSVIKLLLEFPWMSTDILTKRVTICEVVRQDKTTCMTKMWRNKVYGTCWKTTVRSKTGSEWIGNE